MIHSKNYTKKGDWCEKIHGYIEDTVIFYVSGVRKKSRKFDSRMNLVT
jgi:hypothetical protein